MSFLVLKKNKFFEYLETINSEQLGIYTSFFLHFSIFLFVVGLPDFFKPEQINVSTIIPIEIINIADITSAPKNINEKNIGVKKETIIKEKKFSSSKKQEIKKVFIKDNSEIENQIVEKNLIIKNDFIIKEKKNTSKEVEKKKIVINEKNIESLKIKKIKPKPKPLDDDLKLNRVEATKPKPKTKPLKDNIKLNKVEATKPKPKTKPLKDNIKLKKDVVVEIKPKQEIETEFNIASLLKDLRNDEINPKNKIKEEADEEKIQKLDKSKEKITEENVSLSISEIDLVIQQLGQCFILPVGTKLNKTEFVKVSVKILPNRMVVQNSIRIVDTNIGKRNPLYGPITRSAMNTFLDPNCSPLKFPAEKYDLWKNISITFDYSAMMGN